MKSSQYYDESPYPRVDHCPDHPVGRHDIPDDDKLRYEQQRYRHPHHPPMGKKGFLMDNGAALRFYAHFHFKYDSGIEEEVNVYNGDAIDITFNSGNIRVGSLPEIITVTGILKEINRVPDGFVLTVDASKTYNGKVYKIGSKAILGITKTDISIDGKPDGNNPGSNPDDLTADSVEIIEAIVNNHPTPHPRPEIVPRPDPFHPFEPPHSHCNHVHPPKNISWNDQKLEMITDEFRKYKSLGIGYAKKSSVDVLMVITDLDGHIVYKALDNGGSVSMKRMFVWPLRDYISYIKENVDLVTKLTNYTVDSAGRFVMTKDALLDPVVREVDKSNECFPESTQFMIHLVCGDNLLDYNPFVDQHYHYEVISKRFELNAAMIKSALYESEVKEEDDGSTDGNDQGTGSTTTPGEVPGDDKENNGGSGSGGNSTDDIGTGTTITTGIENISGGSTEGGSAEGTVGSNGSGTDTPGGDGGTGTDTQNSGMSS